jgi:hypothetical protein
MPRKPGRPADAPHQCIALLRSLTAHAQDGRTTRDLMTDMQLDPDAPGDVRMFRRDVTALRVSGWQTTSVRRGLHDRDVLRVADHGIRTTFTPEHRAELLRAAERAQLGQRHEDHDQSRANGTPSLRAPGAVRRRGRPSGDDRGHRPHAEAFLLRLFGLGERVRLVGSETLRKQARSLLTAKPGGQP